jgi:hypothetical protein
MEASIPNNWILIDQETLDGYLSCNSYMREAYCGGIYYTVPKPSGDRFAILMDDGKIFANPKYLEK